MQIFLISVMILSEGLRINMRHDIFDLIMLLKNRRGCRFYALITLDKKNLFLKDGRSKVTNMLDLLLQVHQLKSSRVLEVLDRLAKPTLVRELTFYENLRWKSDGWDAEHAPCGTFDIRSWRSWGKFYASRQTCIFLYVLGSWQF